MVCGNRRSADIKHRKYHNVAPPPHLLHCTWFICCACHTQMCVAETHRPVIDVYELMSIFFCEFTVSGWWMHSISLVIHLIYSLQQLPTAGRHLAANRCRHCPVCLSQRSQSRDEAGREKLLKQPGAQCGVTLHRRHSSVRVSVTKAGGIFLFFFFCI